MPSDATASIDTDRTLILTNDDGWDAPRPGCITGRRRPRFNGGIADRRPFCRADVRVWAHRHNARAAGGDSTERGCAAVAGTPADCVRLATPSSAPAWAELGLGRDQRWRQSGHGHLLRWNGRGCLRSAHPRSAWHRIVTLYHSRTAVDWHRAARWAEMILRRLMALPWEPGTLWNVNLPQPEPDPSRPSRSRFLPVRPVPPAPAI